jgi:hypothetical protein
VAVIVPAVIMASVFSLLVGVCIGVVLGHWIRTKEGQ